MSETEPRRPVQPPQVERRGAADALKNINWLMLSLAIIVVGAVVLFLANPEAIMQGAIAQFGPVLVGVVVVAAFVIAMYLRVQGVVRNFQRRQQRRAKRRLGR